MVLGPVVSALANAPTGIGVGRGAAGVGAVAVIGLQNKVIAGCYRPTLLWAITVSDAVYPIGVGLAQLVLPPVALVYGWRAALVVGITGTASASPASTIRRFPRL